jgi:hypothetical protein
MKTLILITSFLFFILSTIFAQSESVNFQDNDKIINYILQGKYHKVIKLTKISNFDQVVIFDTVQPASKLYSKDDGSFKLLSDSLFISYMSRLRSFINSSTIFEATHKPSPLNIEINNRFNSDCCLPGIIVPIQYCMRSYDVFDTEYKYSLILSFVDLKIRSIGIAIEKIQY